MRLNLPKPTPAYDRQNEAAARKDIEVAVGSAQGKTENVDLINGRKIIHQDRTTKQRRELYLDNGEFWLGDPI